MKILAALYNSSHTVVHWERRWPTVSWCTILGNQSSLSPLAEPCQQHWCSLADDREKKIKKCELVKVMARVGREKGSRYHGEGKKRCCKSAGNGMACRLVLADGCPPSAAVMDLCLPAQSWAVVWATQPQTGWQDAGTRTCSAGHPPTTYLALQVISDARDSFECAHASQSCLWALSVLAPQLHGWHGLRWRR